MKFTFNPLTAQFDVKAANCSGSGGGTISPVLAASPTIQNIAVPNADTETTITIPTGTKKILLKVRDYASTLKLSYVLGESGNKFINITRGCSYTEENILTITASNKIYIQSTKPNVVIECLTWI